MVKIFDIETTLKGFSNQILRRIQETGIRNAERVPIMMHGDHKCTEICFSSDQVSIDRTDNLNDSLVLSEQEAVRFLFGQCPPDSMFSLSHNKGVLNSVLPLDFYIWNNDTV